MKKLILLFVILIPFKVFGISASSAIVMDLDNGRVLYGYNTEEKKLIASTTKIMTAIVAIENGDLDEVVTTGEEVYEAFGSSIYLEVGEEITLKDLLYGLMLRSGNDAALVIAKEVAGSKEEFVYLMNEYASNLKMDNTVFYNPHGLEENNGSANKSTAYDMAKLTKYAYNNKIFRKIFGTKEYTSKTNYKTYCWKNKNKLLSEEYVTGGKTGFTELARRTLVTTGSMNGINLVVVTLNDPNDWQDHKDLYSSTFKKYKSYLVIDKSNFKINDDYYKSEKLFVKNDVFMSLAKDELKKIKINIELVKLDSYVNDEIVGYASVYLNDDLYHKEPIYIKVKKQEKLNFFQKFIKWVHSW